MSGNKGGKAKVQPVKSGVKGDSKAVARRAGSPVRLEAATRGLSAPKEHEFIDSPFANEITMHTNIRVFNVSILYSLAADSTNPLMDAVREQVQTNEHMIQVTIAGPRLEEIPARDIYETIEAYRSRAYEATTSNSRQAGVAQPIRIHDSEADYYGVLAAERLVRETNGQARILGVDVDEMHIAAIFLNAVAG